MMGRTMRFGAARRVVVALVVVAGLVGGTASAGPAGAEPGPCESFDDTVAYVCGNYFAFTRRYPDAGEVAYWTSRMPGAKATFVKTLGRSVESRQRMIEAYYLRYGNGPVDPASLAYWTPRVLETNGLRRLQAALLGSYQGTIDGFLHKTFGTVLGRDPSSTDSQYWGTRVVQKTRTRVASEIMGSNEARRLLVRWSYYNDANRMPDPAGWDYWSERVRTGLSYLDLRIALRPSIFPEATYHCNTLHPPVTYACTEA